MREFNGYIGIYRENTLEKSIHFMSTYNGSRIRSEINNQNNIKK